MSHITVFNNEKAFLRKFLIFIFFSAIILLSFASCGKTEEGKSTEMGAETLSEHVTETETSAATEPYIPDDNFVTIGGVLTEYKGTDTVVTIPDYVTEIADRAFENAPSADKITEIRLGRGVTKISAKAFFGLDLLTRVESCANPNFTTKYIEEDNSYALYSVADPLIFCFPDRSDGSITFFDDPKYCGDYDGKKFTAVIYDALFELYFSFDEYGRYAYLCSVNQGGNVLTFDEIDGSFHGNMGFYALKTQNVFVYMCTGYIYADSYIFTENGVFKVLTINARDIDYGISFYTDGDMLKYRKVSRQYFEILSGQTVMSGAFCHMTDRNDFCEEFGFAEVSADGISYIPEKTYNISEYFTLIGADIDKCFEEFNQNGEYKNLDDYLNRKKENE